jgi:hypothetical protein
MTTGRDGGMGGEGAPPSRGGSDVERPTGESGQVKGGAGRTAGEIEHDLSPAVRRPLDMENGRAADRDGVEQA